MSETPAEHWINPVEELREAQEHGMEAIQHEDGWVLMSKGYAESLRAPPTAPGKEEASAFVQECQRKVSHGESLSLLDCGGLIELAFGNPHVFRQAAEEGERVCQCGTDAGTKLVPAVGENRRHVCTTCGGHVCYEGELDPQWPRATPAVTEDDDWAWRVRGGDLAAKSAARSAVTEGERLEALIDDLESRFPFDANAKRIVAELRALTTPTGTAAERVEKALTEAWRRVRPVAEARGAIVGKPGEWVAPYHTCCGNSLDWQENGHAIEATCPATGEYHAFVLVAGTAEPRAVEGPDMHRPIDAAYHMQRLREEQRLRVAMEGLERALEDVFGAAPRPESGPSPESPRKG